MELLEAISRKPQDWDSFVSVRSSLRLCPSKFTGPRNFGVGVRGSCALLDSRLKLMQFVR